MLQHVAATLVGWFLVRGFITGDFPALYAAEVGICHARRR